MRGWREYRFSDFVEISPSVTLKPGAICSFVEMADLKDGNKFCEPSTVRPFNSSGTRFQERDTLFARITPCLENGKICQVRNLLDSKGFGSTEFHVFRGREGISDTDFVYYLSRWSDVRDFAEANFHGTSGRQRVPRESFDNLFLNLPDYNEQQAIAGVLSSLDDKIDLLHRQNKTLEGIAEALWRKMFVEEADPEWKRGKLEDIASFSNGKSRPEEVFNGTIPIYGGNGILGYTNHSNAEGESIVIGRVGAYCGSLYIENRPIWITDNALLAKPIKTDFSKYLLYLLKSLDLNSMAEGSSHPLLTQTLLNSIEIDIPHENNIFLFDSRSIKWLAKIDFNKDHIQTLSALRNLILPKLVKGEVRVSYE